VIVPHRRVRAVLLKVKESVNDIESCVPWLTDRMVNRLARIESALNALANDASDLAPDFDDEGGGREQRRESDGRACKKPCGG